ITFLSVDDRAAVRWLADQNAGASGRVVIAEALGNEYDPVSAGMATYSGAATVLGWAGHELQWRGPVSEVAIRQSDLGSLHPDPPSERARPPPARHGVQCVGAR